MKGGCEGREEGRGMGVWMWMFRVGGREGLLFRCREGGKIEMCRFVYK